VYSNYINKCRLERGIDVSGQEWVTVLNEPCSDVQPLYHSYLRLYTYLSVHQRSTLRTRIGKISCLFIPVSCEQLSHCRRRTFRTPHAVVSLSVSTDDLEFSQAHKPNTLHRSPFYSSCFLLLLWWNVDFPWLVLFFLLHPFPSLPHHKNLPVNFLRNTSSLVQGLRCWEIAVTNWCTLYPVIWCKDCPVATTGVKGKGGFFLLRPCLSTWCGGPTPPALIPVSFQTKYIRTCYQKKGDKKGRGWRIFLSFTIRVRMLSRLVTVDCCMTQQDYH
jgi:hypothetical protein